MGTLRDVAGSPREERLAKNEAMFRAANEGAAGWQERHGDSETELYFCECADAECREHVALTKAEYENVRESSLTFFIVPAHEVPDVETVVERHDDWVVIEKAPEVAETVERLNPRTDQ